jgi:hypothetical protein
VRSGVLVALDTAAQQCGALLNMHRRSGPTARWNSEQLFLLDRHRGTALRMVAG